MMIPRLFLFCAALLIGCLGVTDGSAQQFLRGSHSVQFIDNDERLDVYASPGGDSEVVDQLYNGAPVDVTGGSQQIGDTLWMPVRRVEGDPVEGWVNRLYLAANPTPEAFCADEDARELVETVRRAVRARDGDAIGDLLAPGRGLYLGVLWWGGVQHLTEEEARGMFTDLTPRQWGGEAYVYSLRNYFVPLLQRHMLPASRITACYDSQDSLMLEGSFEASSNIRKLPFYSILHPGAPGFEMDWHAWAVGIDLWEGKPTLAYLCYYYWVP